VDKWPNNISRDQNDSYKNKNPLKSYFFFTSTTPLKSYQKKNIIKTINHKNQIKTPLKPK
jgi:hypothetical protein